jgi:YVTN family beta-propeller protein
VLHAPHCAHPAPVACRQRESARGGRRRGRSGEAIDEAGERGSVAGVGDGKTVWVTNEGSNDVTAVDLASGRTTTIAAGNAPRKIVVQPAAAKTAAAGGAISIANFAFAPAALAVAVGTTVAWHNDDGAPHAIAFADGAPASDLLLPGQGFARTFTKAGRFDYACSVHPHMRGTVTVGP